MRKNCGHQYTDTHPTRTGRGGANFHQNRKTCLVSKSHDIGLVGSAREEERCKVTDQTYWPRVAAQLTALKQQFPGKRDCHVTANGPMPRVVEVSLENGARLLVDATHRLSADGEVAEYQREQELRRAQQRDFCEWLWTMLPTSGCHRPKRAGISHAQMLERVNASFSGMGRMGFVSEHVESLKSIAETARQESVQADAAYNSFVAAREATRQMRLAGGGQTRAEAIPTAIRLNEVEQ